VEGVVECHDGRTARGFPGDLHGVLYGLGSGVREHRLLRVISGRECVQSFGELDVWLVSGYVETGVGVEFGLLLDGCDDFRGGVPDVQDRDPGCEVDQPIAVDVFDDAARGPRRDDRVERGDSRCDGGGAAVEPLPGLRAGDLGYELAFLGDGHVGIPPHGGVDGGVGYPPSVLVVEPRVRGYGDHEWRSVLYGVAIQGVPEVLGKAVRYTFRTIAIWPSPSKTSPPYPVCR